MCLITNLRDSRQDYHYLVVASGSTAMMPIAQHIEVVLLSEKPLLASIPMELHDKVMRPPSTVLK